MKRQEKKFAALYKKYRGQFIKWWNKEIDIQAVQYLDYYFAKYRLYTPRFLLFHSKRLLRKRGFIIFGTILCFVVLFVGIQKVNLRVNLSVKPNVATAFFFGAAATVGSLLAIVASISQFAIQAAFSSLPKGFHKIAINLWKYGFIFFSVSAIVLALFVAGLGYGRLGIGLSAFSVETGVFLIGFSLFLIYLLIQNVYSNINPENVLLKATKQALNALDELHKTVTNLAKIQQKHPGNEQQYTLEEIEASLYQSIQTKTALDNINLRLAYLFDYHNSLVSSEQKSAARDVLDHIRATIIKYLLSRKKNSLILPDPLALLVPTSDSKEFLTPNLERLMSVGEVYMQKQDPYGIMHIVNLFIALANTSAEIIYIGSRRSENPILAQVRGYFDMLMQRAINSNSFEGIYQGLRFYKRNAEIAIEGYLHFELSSLHTTLWKITKSAISSRHEPALGEIFNVYTHIINKLILSKYSNLEIELSDLLRHLKEITYFSYLMTLTGTRRDNLFTLAEISKPFKELGNLSLLVAEKVATIENEDEKSEWQHILITIVDKLGQVLRDLAQKIKNPDHMLILSFGQIIRDVGKLVIKLTNDEQWASHRRELEIQATSYLHLPHWFMYEVDKIEGGQSYDSLVEAVVQMGLLAMQKNMVSTAQEAIRIIFQFANDMLTKEKPEKHYGFTEPRTVELACYIGILALKLNKQEVVQTLIPQIRVFEQEYFQAHFSKVPEHIDSLSPSPDQLEREIRQLVDKRSRWQFERWGLYKAREMLFGAVDKRDIQAFIDLVWPMDT